MRERWLVLLAMFSLLHASCALLGQEGASGDKQSAAASEAADLVEWNLQLSTYGGKQFWTDVEICEDCRIQCNVVTGHYRLLDDRDVRQTWGALPKCQAKFAEIKRERGIVAPRGKVVIVLHGLLRSREQLQGICNYLEQEGHYTVLNFSYASSRAEVGEHAAALASVVDGCRDAEEINFVAHSLGNIVVRHYLADCTAAGKKLDPRIHRVVMLGPPNNGAELANRFRNNPLFQLVWGRSGKQLADNWDKLQPHLATPSCEFGIIAGGRGSRIGLNPLVTGDDDMVVSVAETKLPGAADFLTVPVLHGDMMDDIKVRKSTLCFLQHGYFVAADQKQPLPVVTAQSESP